MQHHKYNIETLENMIPWQKEVYVLMLSRHLEEERARLTAARK
jgi:hypothetical protein